MGFLCTHSLALLLFHYERSNMRPSSEDEQYQCHAPALSEPGAKKTPFSLLYYPVLAILL
jgi:hypothetical protein